MRAAMPSVAVVDDDVMVLRSLSRLLQAAGFGVEIFSSPQDFLAKRNAQAIGCVVMDLAMPGIDGLEVQRTLARAADAPPVVFISGQGSVPASVQAMKGGAVDFLTKPLDAGRLIEAVRAALERGQAAQARRAAQTEVTARLATLTPRECEVLAGVVAGKLNKQIAADLGTAEKTVKVHRARMMRKMEVTSLAALVRAWTVTQPAQV